MAEPEGGKTKDEKQEEVKRQAQELAKRQGKDWAKLTPDERKALRQQVRKEQKI